MVDQHNSNTPAMGHLVLSDITDIKESLEFHKDVFESFLNAWSNTDATNKYPVLLSDADLDTLIQAEESTDEDIIRLDCGGTAQILAGSGYIKPAANNYFDFGSATKEFKDLYVDGVAYIGTTEGDTYDIDGTNTATLPTNGVSSSGVIMTGTSSSIVWFYLNTAPQGWKVLSTGGDTVCGVSGGTQSYNVNGGNPDSSATWTVSGLTHSHYHSLNTRGESDGSGTYCCGNNRTGTTSAGISSTGGWRPKASVGKLFQLDTA